MNHLKLYLPIVLLGVFSLQGCETLLGGLMHREDRQMAKQAPRYSIKPGGSNQHSSSKIYSMGSPGRAVTTHDRSFYEALEPPKVANEVSSAPKSRPKGGVSVEYALENAEELKLNDLQIQALKRLKAERRLQ